MRMNVVKHNNFYEKVNHYISMMMCENKISYDDYHCFSLWEVIESKGTIIREFDFQETKNRCISGMLVVDSKEVTIGVNAQLDAMSKNFIINHEIVHALFHREQEEIIFIDIKETNQSSMKIEKQEREADLGALIFLLPDDVLIHYLKKGWSSTKLSAHFGISMKDLFTRFIQVSQRNPELKIDTLQFATRKMN